MDRLSVAVLCGRAGRLTTKNGGFRPGRAVSGNVLLSGSALPPLPFARYTQGCALDGIAFACPLPAGVETCHRAGVPALAAGKSDGCLNPQVRI